MPNYNITPCDPNLTPFIVYSELPPFVTGGTYYLTFGRGTNPGCFTIGGITEDNENDFVVTISSQYNDCLSCLQNNDFSFIVTACTVSELGGPVNSSQFNEFPINKFYTLCSNAGEFEGCLCFEVLGIIPEPYPFIFGISGPYSDCNCQEPPRSANTETIICETCDGGQTVFEVTPPHPVWTDGKGTNVTQMNAVTLGGMFGLNS